MAQTKKRRRTKHRGNAAGVVEVRGRTGRKPTSTEKKATVRMDAAARREARMNQPPTWRSALNRAVIAAGLFVAILLLALHEKPLPALFTGVFILAFYIPLGYYFDLFIYRRRLAKKART
jgi:hypothetical protein